MDVKNVAVVVSIALCCAGLAMGRTEWVGHPDKPVIGPGEPGEWDAFNRVPGTVLFDGSTYHMWFAGRAQSSGTNQNGHATSTDGVEWIMDPTNPVLTPGAPEEWDEHLGSPAPGRDRRWSSVPHVVLGKSAGGDRTGRLRHDDDDPNPLSDFGPVSGGQVSLAEPPLHTLPHDEFIARLKTLTNVRLLCPEEDPNGWPLTHDPFPGWETMPTG